MANLLSLLSRWRSDAEVGTNVVEWRKIPARQAQFVPLPDQLNPGLQQALRKQGIQALYSHQRQAWEFVASGENLVVVTGTASGKTLCYQLPVLHSLLADPDATALMIFPTKALAQDQLNSLQGILEDSAGTAVAGRELNAAVYDGDTPARLRRSLREKTRIILTNPDMLHTGILPHHTAWAEFLRGLRFVVVDEMHIYRGVFGSHVANTIRRLKRIARFYGAYPQFILTSATIGNPAELARRLVEEEIRLVDTDGSGRGSKEFLIYNPPVIDQRLGLRRSSLQESERLAEDLISGGIQTIVFGRTRRSVELMLTYLREGLQSDTVMSKPGAIRGYRSGYLPAQRREIERGLREGDVRGVVATTALELGIDIGGMGAAVISGYPGTIAAAWQQAGRAGRGEEASLSVLVASASPLDQFLARHPDYFFGRSAEHGLINPDNLLILLEHLRCAAFELPFHEGERYGNIEVGQLAELLEFLEQEGTLHRSGPKYFWTADQYPAQAVSLRSASPQTVLLQVETSPDDVEGGAGSTIGEVDLESAAWMVHPGAIYLHEAQTYYVRSLDLEQHIARLTPVSSDYYTTPHIETTVQLIQQQAGMFIPGGVKSYGELLVTSQVVGFRKVRWHTQETLGLEPLDIPPTELATTGYWVGVAEETVQVLTAEGLWANIPNDYGPGWNRIKELVRLRDGYRCQVCGTPESGRTHDVHHITPFRMFDSAESANQLNNLVTLCSSCHHKTETAVRVRSGLAGLAFTLGNLAPLYLMCDPGDLGIHSDPQSPITEGKPTVVIYDLVPAGIGFSQRLFEVHQELMESALALVTECECEDGCPSCVGPGGENGSGGKRETLALLNVLAGKR